MKLSPTFFAPHLYMKNVAAGIEFCQKAFGAVELRRWSNPDGGVHVVEMTIDGLLFHIHEEVPRKGQLSPETLDATTSLVGVFTPDPDTLFRNAVACGGRVVDPMEDFDYGYRQGVVADPFGHQWLIQKRISEA